MQPIIQVTEDTFEHIIHLITENTAIDLRAIKFIDPYGMVGLLEIQEKLASRKVFTKQFICRSVKKFSSISTGWISLNLQINILI
ncbi:MAG: hypothetical protein U0586_04470 [Candidatus Brocadiaceae bacterium]